MIEIRPANASDFDAILTLQSVNQFARLSDFERAHGFLSAEFSREQLRQMSEDLGIDAAFDEGALAGYLCAFPCAGQLRPPVIQCMIAAFSECRFAGRALDQHTCYIYGPVCIAASHRGKGILAQLFAAQRARLDSTYPTGAAFIAHRNPRSLHAHVQKLGMAQAGTFNFNGNAYHIVAFSTRS